MKIIFAADFETTVFEGQKETGVWSSALCPVRTAKQQQHGIPKPEEADVVILNNIPETLEYLESFTQTMTKKHPRASRDVQDAPHTCSNKTVTVYYHNIRFDGSFWVDWLLRNGYIYYEKEHKKDEDVPQSFSCMISDMGQWYTVRIVQPSGMIIEMRDSLKLLPFSLRKIGKDFKTEHQKLEMDYEHRPGDLITEEERRYIRNDVLVLSEALEIMFAAGLDKITIGAACLNEYRRTIPKMYESENYMDLTKFDCPEYISAGNADEYIRRAYRGGWCYVKKDKAGQIFSGKNAHVIGCTADVNSLYPSMMHSMSGNRYPVGMPHFIKGAEILKYSLPRFFSFVHIRCRFKLKSGFLPFVQIKGSPYYRGNEMQEDSRPTIKGRRMHSFKIETTGETVTDKVELYLSCVDFELFLKHYAVESLEILDGCWFWTDIGMFDDYIDKWSKVKQTSKGAQRTIAKLMLNNLYGKFSTSPRNTTKHPYLGEERDAVELADDEKPDKRTLYIPIGAAITSYARRFTITAAQANFSSFCYADTDSIHCLTAPENVYGIKIHDTAFCCWKIETQWTAARFERQKTYIENTTDGLLIKCAGLPENCKKLLAQSMTETEDEARQYAEQLAQIKKPETSTQWEQVRRLEFLKVRRTLEDFQPGLTIPGKLIPVRIHGGTVLEPRYFTMKKETL